MQPQKFIDPNQSKYLPNDHDNWDTTRDPDDVYRVMPDFEQFVAACLHFSQTLKPAYKIFPPNGKKYNIAARL